MWVRRGDGWRPRGDPLPGGECKSRAANGAPPTWRHRLRQRICHFLWQLSPLSLKMSSLSPAMTYCFSGQHLIFDTKSLNECYIKFYIETQVNSIPVYVFYIICLCGGGGGVCASIPFPSGRFCQACSPQNSHGLVSPPPPPDRPCPGLSASVHVAGAGLLLIRL